MAAATSIISVFLMTVSMPHTLMSRRLLTSLVQRLMIRPSLGAVVVAHREPLELVKDLAPQIELHPLAGIDHDEDRLAMQQ